MPDDDERRPQHPDRDADADETQLERAEHSIDEAKDAAEKNRRLADAQAGFENLPLEDPPQHTTGHTPP